MFDKNKDGFVSHEELKQVMASLGENLSDAQIADMSTLLLLWFCWLFLVREADADNDGKINFEEFMKMMSDK